MSIIAYRPEIDGLRTLAVFPVVMFHAGIPGFNGGFIGVDIFFVISGYLITAILKREMSENKYSILNFYERRARRILPALLFVIATSIPFAIWLMLPYELLDFGQSIVSTMLFTSNILFFSESSYFAPDSALKPLLHTWTLAVEEQFYILFPAFLWLVWPLGGKKIIFIFSAIAVLSLISAEVLWRYSLTAAFFLTPGRVWELLAGALLALASRQPAERVGRLAREILAGIGLLLIIASVIFLNSQFPYPSVFTVAPVAGATLVIAFATSGTMTARVLSLKPMVGVGLISYSAYLWHQPLFAFVKLWLGGRPSLGLSLTLVVITFALAVASWRWVERPFRDRRIVPPRRVARDGGVGVAVAIVVGIGLIVSDGLVVRYQPAERELALFNPVEEGRYIRVNARRYANRAFDDDAATPNVLVVGDSYAEDFIYTATENEFMRNASMSVLLIPSNCGIVLRKGGHDEFIEPKMRPRCTGTSSLYDHEEMLRAADTVILAANWPDWVIELLPDTLAELRRQTAAEIVLINRKSFGPINMRKFLGMNSIERRQWRNPLYVDVITSNRRLREVAGETSIIDIPKLVCDEGNQCPVFTPEGALLSSDGHHYTRKGAQYIGTKIFAQEPLSRLR